MDLILVLAVGSLAVIIICVIAFFIQSKGTGEKKTSAAPAQGAAQPQDVRGRRAQMLRNRNARRNVQEEVVEQPDNESAKDLEKVGAKKRAKLEAKAEKKVQREAEANLREERKRREEQQRDERRRLEREEEEQRTKLEEEAKRARELKEQKEHEEYLKMKEAFKIEEEGNEEGEELDEGNLLQEYVNFIKTQKVVVVEDLAAKFKLKTQAAIDRIKDLQKDNILTGIIDDRGKFIYVSPDEMNAVAKFIKQRGRVSIHELAENSNQLIQLAPLQVQ